MEMPMGFFIALRYPRRCLGLGYVTLSGSGYVLFRHLTAYCRLLLPTEKTPTPAFRIEGVTF